LSIDRRIPITDYHGNTPCIEPHILGRLLDKLRERISNEQQVKPDPWAGIDRLARDMNAAR
jgi:hypothetical protein